MTIHMSPQIASSITTRKYEIFIVCSGLLAWFIIFIVDMKFHPPSVVKTGLFLSYLGLFLWLNLKSVFNNNLLIQRLILLAQLVVTLVLYHLFFFSILPILFVIWGAQIPEYFRGKQLVAVFLWCNTGVFLVEGLRATNIYYFLGPVIYLCFQLFAVLSTSSRVSEIESKKALENANMELLSAQSLLSQSSENQERLRIARDLHDSIGHKLTALSLNLEYAKHQPPSDPGVFISELKQDVSDTLSQLRKIVTEERDKVHISLSAFLSDLQSTLPRQITLKYDDDLSVLDQELSRELMFCLQESVSNAIRHGQASMIEIEKINSHPLTLRIHDNGKKSKTWKKGNGLTGMNERLSKFDGSASLSSSDKLTGMSVTLIANDISHIQD